VVAGIGGLFAIGIAEVVIHRDVSLFLRTPILNMLSWLVCMPLGWVLGGQIGPRVGEVFRNARAEIVGGVIGGTIPILAVAALGWYLVKR